VFSNSAQIQRLTGQPLRMPDGGWVPPSPQEKRYIYKVPLAWKVEPGDLLLVESPNSGLTIVSVIEAHDSPQIDIDANHEYKWAAQKIDLSEYNALRDREAKFKDTMRDIERVKQRETVVEDFRNHLPADSEARKLFDNAVSALAAPIEGVATPAPSDESKAG